MKVRNNKLGQGKVLLGHPHRLYSRTVPVDLPANVKTEPTDVTTSVPAWPEVTVLCRQVAMLQRRQIGHLRQLAYWAETAGTMTVVL